MIGARPAPAGHAVTKPYGGVNTHLNFFNTPYGNIEMTAEATKQLGARWARNNAIPPYEGASWYKRVYSAFCRVHDDGSGRPKTYFSVAGGHPGEPVDDTLDTLAPLVDEGIIKIIEGANEWDLNYKEHGFPAATFFQDLRKHQEELYTKVHARFPGVQVAGPSLFSRNARRWAT
jgi:hypothetical protein